MSYVPTEKDVLEVIADLEYFAGVDLVPDQLRALIAEYPELQKEFDDTQGYGGTDARDLIMDCLAKKVTGEEGWPIGKDSEERKSEFLSKMIAGCKKLGYRCRLSPVAL